MDHEEIGGNYSDNNSGENTPFTLLEYGEVPEGYVPLYISVKKESVDHISKLGFRVSDNQSEQRHGKIEEIFQIAGERNGSGINRDRCVFAIPRPPHQIKMGLTFDADKEVLFEVMVDPIRCLVVDGESFTEASSCLDQNDGEGAEDWADKYWRNSKKLVDYILEGHDGGDEDGDDFQFPEVLIPDDIPTSRIKLVKNYRDTKYD